MVLTGNMAKCHSPINTLQKTINYHHTSHLIMNETNNDESMLKKYALAMKLKISLTCIKFTIFKKDF